MISPALDAKASVPTLSFNGGAGQRFNVSFDCEGRARHPMTDGSVIVGRSVAGSWDGEFLVSAIRALLS